MSKFVKILVFYTLICFGCYGAFGQTPALSAPTPANDPEAVALAARSIGNLKGNQTIQDVIMTGSATWNGSESGTVTLKAERDGESRMDINLPGGNRTEIRDMQTGKPLGRWLGPNNISGSFAFHNAWSDPLWFFPALGYLNGGPDIILSYVGQETRKNISVYHIRASILRLGKINNQHLQKLGVTDFFLNVDTLLPVSIEFDNHPDKSLSTDLRVEIEFSDYQTISGVPVPMRISRRQQGALICDFTISNVTINSGIPPAVFTIN